MRGLRTPIAIAAVLLGLAGCGGSSSSSSTAGHAAAAGPPTALFKVTLSGQTGQPAGAPGGRGLAVIAVHGLTVVCWRFAHLHGFTGVTTARVQSGLGPHAPTAFHLTAGKAFHHRGCRHVKSGTLTAIQRHAARYAVTIASTAYPSGAVRGRL